MMLLSLAMRMKFPDPPLGLKYRDPTLILPSIVTKMIVQLSINNKFF